MYRLYRKILGVSLMMREVSHVCIVMYMYLADSKLVWAQPLDSNLETAFQQNMRLDL